MASEKDSTKQVRADDLREEIKQYWSLNAFGRYNHKHEEYLF